jgi:alkanesulfonate monooxygenase SsuD/methylene tetrahydromethanopterin reductase-like flavin-dependent oxidoreductase (luciferase family)
VLVEIAIQTMAGYRATLDLARWAEANGVVALAAADHYLTSDETASDPALDQLTVLAAVAAGTSSLQLATLVSPITFRHPAVLLKQAVSLDEISGGRFTLGVGTGWMEPEHSLFGIEFPAEAERFDRLEEALGYLRAALAPEPVGFRGRYYNLAPVDFQPRPAHLRLIVGGTGGRRTPTLAGRFADEFNAYPGKADLAGRVGLARAAAVEAGRDPGDLMISTAFPVVAGGTDALYEDALSAFADRRGKTPGAVEADLTGVGIPHGTPGRVREELDSLAAMGVSRIYLQVGRADSPGVRRSVEVFLEAVS